MTVRYIKIKKNLSEKEAIQQINKVLTMRQNYSEVRRLGVAPLICALCHETSEEILESVKQNIEWCDKRIEDLKRFVKSKNMETPIMKEQKRKQNKIKRLVREVEEWENENGISPTAKLRVSFSVLIKLPDKISKKISCRRSEILYYKIWDTIGDRLQWATSTNNVFITALDLIDAPLYLYNQKY